MAYKISKGLTYIITLYTITSLSLINYFLYSQPIITNFSHSFFLILFYLVHPYFLTFPPREQCKYICVRPGERKWSIANFHEKNSRIYKMNVVFTWTNFLQK